MDDNVFTSGSVRPPYSSPFFNLLLALFGAFIIRHLIKLSPLALPISGVIKEMIISPPPFRCLSRRRQRSKHGVAYVGNVCRLLIRFIVSGNDPIAHPDGCHISRNCKQGYGRAAGYAFNSLDHCD